MQTIVIPPVQTTSLTPLECDFCSALRPEMLFFAARQFRFTIRRDIIDAHAGAWGTCEGCAPFVRARDVVGMIARSAPSTLTALEYSAGLMKGLAAALLDTPAPVFSRIRLLPKDDRWVESDVAASSARNPYVTSN